MNTADILDGDFGQGIALQTRDLNYLRTAGKWGQFIAITGIVMFAIGTVFVIVGGFSSFTAGQMLGRGSLMLLPYLLLAGILLYLYVLMYQFSTNAVSASGGKSKSSMTAAFKALARMFIIGGVLFIIYIALLLFALLATAGTLFF